MKIKGHKIVELRSAGEPTREENSWTVTCLCGFQESCSTKEETRREYSYHLFLLRSLKDDNK